MAGLSDYAAEAVLNWEAGVSPMPAIASQFKTRKRPGTIVCTSFSP